MWAGDSARCNQLHSSWVFSGVNAGRSRTSTDRDTFLDFFLIELCVSSLRRGHANNFIGCPRRYFIMKMVSFFLCGPGSYMHPSRCWHQRAPASIGWNAKSVAHTIRSTSWAEQARGFEVTGSRLSTRSLARTCCSSLIPRPISICARNVLQ
jgi:hypothetical protein